MSAPPVPRPVLFGEVLFDHFPDGSVVLGGAPFNVARHLHGFGLEPLLVTRVGRDPLGARVAATCAACGMDTAGLQHDAARPTGTVEVTLEAGEPTFAIRDRVAWDAIADPGSTVRRAALLYHGTLALRHATSAATLHTLRRRLAAPVFLDVNLRAPWWQRDAVLEQVAAARWVKLNAGELDALTGSGDGSAAVAALRAGNGPELVVVTHGAAGAAAYDAAGRCVLVRPQRTGPVVDTVGAGDAFASVLIAGLLQDWPLDVTLQRAQQFASRIVAQRGAVPEDPDYYRPYVADWNTR